MKHISLFVVFLVSLNAAARHYQLKVVNTGRDAAFRGLSVIDNQTVWASGSKGTIGRSTDGGNTWTFTQVKGYEKCDFRSIYAFNRHVAVIASTGAPAYILRTTDGGQSWTEVYKNEDTAAFFDGICFWNKKEGIAYGDPIGNKLLIVTTHDGGQTWQPIASKDFPQQQKGEASFAASGTCIRCMGKSKVIIATGGTQSSILYSADKGAHFTRYPTPMLKAKTTTGIFSVAVNNKRCIVVGGDYTRDTLSERNAMISTDHFKTWAAPARTTRGYRECVEFITKKKLFAVGPTGIDISDDSGNHFTAFSDEKQFHVIRKSRKDKLIILAGGNGKLGILR